MTRHSSPSPQWKFSPPTPKRCSNDLRRLQKQKYSQRCPSRYTDLKKFSWYGKKAINLYGTSFLTLRRIFDRGTGNAQNIPPPSFCSDDCTKRHVAPLFRWRFDAQHSSRRKICDTFAFIQRNLNLYCLIQRRTFCHAPTFADITWRIGLFLWRWLIGQSANNYDTAMLSPSNIMTHRRHLRRRTGHSLELPAALWAD